MPPHYYIPKLSPGSGDRAMLTSMYGMVVYGSKTLALKLLRVLATKLELVNFVSTTKDHPQPSSSSLAVSVMWNNFSDREILSINPQLLIIVYDGELNSNLKVIFESHAWEVFKRSNLFLDIDQFNEIIYSAPTPAREGNKKQLYDTKKLAGNCSKPERPIKDKEGKPITEIKGRGTDGQNNLMKT
ncbi:unnamed protein product [Schistosoma mattheei]|uniref:Uncharacterized protein n=1 Tax=Schistosoma mattheei TaxID=31246 RepID=A0A183NW99_9TREM|nr:unnamed protein product [Schistosoma mattheei]